MTSSFPRINEHVNLFSGLFVWTKIHFLILWKKHHLSYPILLDWLAIHRRAFCCQANAIALIDISLKSSKCVNQCPKSFSSPSFCANLSFSSYCFLDLESERKEAKKEVWQRESSGLVFWRHFLLWSPPHPRIWIKGTGEAVEVVLLHLATWVTAFSWSHGFCPQHPSYWLWWNQDSTQGLLPVPLCSIHCFEKPKVESLKVLTETRVE